MGTECMLHESIWFDRHVYEEAEELNQMYLNGLPLPVTHDHDHHGHHDHGKHHGKTQHHDHHGKDHHDQHGKNQHHDHHGKNQHHDHHGKNQPQDHHGKNQHHDHHGKIQHQDHHGKNQHQDHHGKNQHHGKHGKGASTSVMEIAEARRKIHQTLTGAPHSASSHGVSEKRIEQLEAENKDLRKQTTDLAEALKKLELRVAQLESSKTTTPAPTPAKQEKKEEKKEESDDDDLFGSDSEEEDEEQERIKKERLEAYYAKKAKKPQVIAKSSITIDVKPWDDETDVNEMEKKVRSISTDGLKWGGSKIIPIAYGIKKLQISCIVEDDKCGSEFLEENITAFEDFVQSVDVVAFNKL